MNWFVAHIIYRIITGKGDHTPQFDEQLKLISAEDENQAFKKASLMGMEGQDIFPNSSGGMVEWKFIGISELTKINTLEDGTELCSRIIESDHPDNYTYFTQQKNWNIEARTTTVKTNTIV